ncbi:hypothetical protein [Aeromonas salmonicida]|uniref:hypothetical protein n=1 Tax=Aeromonas salmonicida TaxID=645 RepID=UPI000A122096|nr:hypothetical protein [Aeromonas salmonicida]ELM3639903.1 hypothetical protein [Aeromonas salmonicida subsp. salmonicida]ELM3742773.1 hypothetical protein [Aeromonas salmonicida subsp. salmonicida]ORJ10461.1 hypothetical protein A7D02_19770 [Aeromonas salmonicida]ORJ15696.1 hypothetical protein A7D03_16315 [Aeromonas salmonicida]QOI93683.1 hypothetical protein G7042_00070 [Aeromonas salmonicida subsp. masoucida]
MSAKKNDKGTANYLCGLIELVLKDCAKGSALVACLSLFFMFIEWINSAPVNFKQTLIDSASMGILLGLVLAIITAIKWAWRKRQASKGG